MKITFVFCRRCLCGLAFLSGSVHANEYFAESDFFGESPMVLTVSRMNKPIADSPASVSIIDRDMIRNSGAREIADIFRMVPGMLVGYHYGHSPAVTYHGLGTEWQRQLQVLIDGRSVFIPSFGGIPWSNLPLLLEDIERVEITRGPNTVTYGSNAFLATINIITRHSAEDVGTKISVTHDLDSDSQARDVYFRVGSQYKDLDWKLSAGLEEDDGYDVEHDSKRLKKLNLRTDFLSAYNQFWTLQAGINDSTMNRGDGTPTNLLRDDETTHSYQNLKWEKLDDKVTTTLKISHTRQDVSNNFTSDPINDLLDTRFGINLFSLLPEAITMDISFDRLSERTDLELYQNRAFKDKIHLVYGFSIRKDKVKSLYLFNDEDTHHINANRLFSSLEWKFDNDLIVDVGFMLEDTTFVDNDLSTRFSLIKKIAPHHNLRLVTSNAKRNPVLYEIIGDTQFSFQLPQLPDEIIPFIPASLLALDEIPIVIWSAPDSISPETIHSLELGLFSEFHDQQINTDIKLFQYKISDQINDTQISAADPVTGINQLYRTVNNEGSTMVRGVEGSFNYSPSHKNFRLYGGLTKLEVDTDNSNNRDSFPATTWFAGGHFDLNDRQQISASIYYVDKMSWLDNSSLMDAHIKLDARYQYLLNKKHNTQFEVIGYNLYEDFNEYVRIGQQKKSILLRLSSSF